MTITIWRDSTLSHLGFSTRNVFECDTGYVGMGKTASCAEPFRSITTFNAYGITVVDERSSTASYFGTIESDKEKEEYILQVILAVLTPKLLAEIIDKIKDDALREGKSIARAEVRHALGITHGF